VITAIIPAAGQGRRMNTGKNKAFLSIFGQSLLVRSALAISHCPEVEYLVVVVAEGEVEEARAMLSEVQGLKPWEIVVGGSERQYSIANALRAIPKESTMILVHDAARPLIEAATISQLIEAVRKYKAAGVAVPVKDTIKVTDEESFAIETPRRDTLWSIQTPQGFDAQLLLTAYAKAEADNFCGTDDASLVERLGVKVKMVQGSYQNIKVTTPEDTIIAEAFLKQEGIKSMGIPRVGMGYDVHALVEERKLILGGVEIPYEFGLLGHSDADVLLHAIKDAMLGAAGLGDIGRHFPDTDPQYKGVSSLLLLAKVREILSEHGYSVNNIDATVVAQKPKLAAYIQAMNANIAETLNIDIRQVNVKATTTEGLGFAGRKEGIAAYAVVSIIGC
jgi:2-C-methyl-D-erythritol 4-phosphate cytidylyltransferase/2-C-methyl-D-erythritol 2,4-cyclodiphosphate synthase